MHKTDTYMIREEPIGTVYDPATVYISYINMNGEKEVARFNGFFEFKKYFEHLKILTGTI